MGRDLRAPTQEAVTSRLLKRVTNLERKLGSYLETVPTSVTFSAQATNPEASVYVIADPIAWQHPIGGRVVKVLVTGIADATHTDFNCSIEVSGVNGDIDSWNFVHGFGWGGGATAGYTSSNDVDIPLAAGTRVRVSVEGTGTPQCAVQLIFDR